MRSRRAAAVAAAAAAAAIVAVGVAVVATRDGGGGGGAPGPTAGSTATAPAPGAVELPPVPDWGDFPGAPPPLVVPPGGEVSAEAVPGGSRLTVERADGSTLAVARVEGATGAYGEVRYLDRRGRLDVVVSAVRAAPAGGGARAAAGGAAVRCGSSARRDAGYRWTRFPIAWRINLRPLPPRISRAAALRAAREARGVWNANRSHCRTLPDASTARFSFAGTTTRRTAQDGRSVVEFGETDRLGGICRGTVACTVTWVVGARVTESDTRVDRLRRGGYFTGSRRRGVDLRSVMVHESGHTLGFAHVAARTVVMFPSIGPRTVGGRILGRGDALGNNAKY